MERCVVCNVRIDKRKAYLILNYDNLKYLACCPLCKSKFEKKPEKYTRKSEEQEG